MRTAFAVLLLVSFSCLVLAMGETGRSPEKGGLAPELILKDLSGKSVKLSDYKGKVVFLNFWAPWCPPCREEMPSMQKLLVRLKGEKFEMLAVMLESGAKSDAIKIKEKGKYTFKILHDPDGFAAKKYGISSIPTTFLIDKKGNIREKIVGSRDWAAPAAVQSIIKLIKS